MRIRDALFSAKSITELQEAWAMTNGKMTRLGEQFIGQLQAIKDSRKAELREVA